MVAEPEELQVTQKIDRAGGIWRLRRDRKSSRGDAHDDVGHPR